MRWVAIVAMIVAILGHGQSSWALEEIEPHKKVIGKVAHFIIDDEANFLARIDTGAATTSVHALDLVVEDEHDEMRKNIGKLIHFVLENEKGERWATSAIIRDVTKVRTSQGVERRYQVPLRVGWDTINKTIDVNLRNRSKMEYKLLVGRDWLAREVVVDLERGVTP
jgi:hypothetical protein